MACVVLCGYACQILIDIDVGLGHRVYIVTNGKTLFDMGQVV